MIYHLLLTGGLDLHSTVQLLYCQGLYIFVTTMVLLVDHLFFVFALKRGVVLNVCANAFTEARLL